MDFQNLPSDPRTDADYDKCFSAFSEALIEENEEIINALISKKGILLRHFSERKDTLLHIVAQRGTVATAAKMCKLGLDVDSQNNSSETPIFYAIKHSAEMVDLLVNNGADVNIKCNLDNLPLQVALLSGSEKSVQIIMNKVFADKSETHLQSIKVENSEETITTLLNHRKDLYLESDDYPLLIFFAAKIGNLDLFRKTLECCTKFLNSVAGVNFMEYSPVEELNCSGLLNKTALHYAVQQQVPEVVHFLLKAGADVNCETIGRYTPLNFAAYFENEEICRILLSFGAQVNPEYWLGFKDEFSGVSSLSIVCGGFAKSRISNQPYFCHKPIFNLGIMKLLLQNHANPNHANQNDGMNPLLEACKAGQLEPVKLLLEFGANIRICDNEGNSALHYATLGENFEIVDLLLEKGLDIEMKNKNDETPCLFILKKEKNACVEMIEYLADLGANINARDHLGSTALHFASNSYCPDNVECLLELGSNFKSLNKNKILYYSSDIHDSRKTLTAFIALKEDTLGDYIYNYIPKERIKLRQIHHFFRICKLEIEELKCTHILENRFSFYDFLSRNIYSALQMIKNKEVRKMFAFEEYKSQFPCYAYLLKKRFERLELLEKTVDDVVAFLQSYKTFNLPFLMVETILSFLSSSDLRNFGRALSGKRD